MYVHHRFSPGAAAYVRIVNLPFLDDMFQSCFRWAAKKTGASFLDEFAVQRNFVGV